MIYTKTSLVLLVEAESIKQDLDPAIPCAVIDILSAWHPELVRLSLDAFNNPSLEYSSPAESVLMNSTIGLMQFTGNQAREAGYKQELDGLLEPSMNLEIGIKLLNLCIAAASNKLDRALVSMYGYRISGGIPKIFSKIKPYHDFLNSPLRPKEKNDGVQSIP